MTQAFGFIGELYRKVSFSLNIRRWLKIRLAVDMVVRRPDGRRGCCLFVGMESLVMPRHMHIKGVSSILWFLISLALQSIHLTHLRSTLSRVDYCIIPKCHTL